MSRRSRRTKSKYTASVRGTRLDVRSGKFLNGVSLSAMRYEREVFNARLKRGEVEHPETIGSTWQVFCGCGHPQCGFISIRRKVTA